MQPDSHSPPVDQRLIFWLCVVPMVMISPFGISQLIAVDWASGGTILALTLVCLSIAYQIYRSGRVSGRKLLLALCIGNVAVLLMIFRLQLQTLYWAYPLLAFNYYFAGPRTGSVLSAISLSLIFFDAYGWADATLYPRIVASLLTTTLLALVFSLSIVRQQRAVAELISHDPLTGASNRREMQAELARALHLHERYDMPSALVLVDIDHFKQVNDKHGHSVGDRVLVELVGLLRKRLRQTDLLFRFGGEEFLVLLPNTSLGAATQLARDLVRLVRETQLAGLQGVTVSAGVACTTGSADPDDWFQRGDRALYRAKQAGRDRVEVYADSPAQVLGA